MNTRDKAIELLKEHFTDRELMLYIKSSDLVYESILDTVQEALNIDLVMPSRLTVEQGHKELLIGEFFEYIEIEEDEFTKVPVTWSNIKDIYKKIVEFHSA